ncbi:GNAT family N-acetyltransferase [Alteromonas sp. a30]|uniref:GNAT family N-acetyltransferase n=1 Tax=Alteromonas sp. a30 TaxID=2730917 RepID=UPI00227E703E|nr:GNAT family N-acetyltransferase [Alteromonas sp. a30]MCY7295707.1 GNAT family N-acetyltransferase [Alteromonas sp. a30]
MQSNNNLTSNILSFNELSPKQLYRIMQLRVSVFVVEQTCYYQELDGLDTLPETRHLLIQEGNQIAGYARILAPGASYSGASSIGRILVSPDYRGQGLGHRVVKEALDLCLTQWSAYPIKIGAQTHLKDFYSQYQFIQVGEPYLEDGISHIHMVRGNDH